MPSQHAVDVLIITALREEYDAVLQVADGAFEGCVRTTTYAELLKIATLKGYSRGWVDSFFWSIANDEDETESAPTSAPSSVLPT